ncbi:hypothetical protein EST38_g10791 [Candolleomyces aberdarensis]|uniref:mannan endo-1,4-beta-mannosidase n=1 Tax=Candolleomyces aberdarensis TaxID=2316362 RepID=A0A4Q2D9C7_9AGAR|nr:hypothetical protein EST38_g10791 [Candolleomyces aberdarensis]
MYVPALWPAVLGALLAFAHAKPTRTVSLSRRAPESPAFVSVEGSDFVVNGAPLKFVGTNAYWLHTLSETDLDKTLADIAAADIKVVRTWAFNNVREIPNEGTWFQMIKNGNITLNEGPNGLQKLDKLVELAEKHGIYLILSLTNNWNPEGADEGTTTGANNTPLPRNSLSNDYGGMDTYIREFGLDTHDLFYTDNSLVSAFKDYASHIAKRYCKSTSVFSWELANDPRCNSTIPSGSCNPKDITRWHADISETIRSVDTNHLISSGAGGFYCADCPKLFPQLPPAPPPQVSPAPGSTANRRRSTRRFLTKAKVLRDRLEARKKTRNAKRNVSGGGVAIRGRWAATATRRQEDFNDVGPGFDGTYGVDSEDILNSPNMDFGSVQYFPDQNNYAPADPNLSPFENIVQQGNEWIQQHAQTAQDFGKPVTLDAFGLVTQQNAPSFVPFNAASAPFGTDAFVTNEQQTQAYESWIDTGLSGGLSGVVQYQWGQEGLTPSAGTPITTTTGSTGIDTPTGATGVSPNDGYSINGVGRQDVVDVIAEGNQRFG